MTPQRAGWITSVSILLLLTGAPGKALGQTSRDSAALLVSQGMVAYRQETRAGLQRAIALWSRAVALYRRAGDRSAEARTLNDIGAVHQSLGRTDSALVYYARSLPMRRAAGDRAGEATTLYNIGVVQKALGRPDSALAYYVQALPIQRAVADRSGEAETLNNIGFVHSAVGRPDSALAYYAQALRIQRAVGDRSGEATTLNNIGLVHNNLGRPESALGYYAQALPILRAVGDRSGEGTTLNNIGFVHGGLGRPDSALAYYALALPILRRTGDRPVEAATLNNIGLLHSGLGRPDSALAYYALALPILHAMGDRPGAATTLSNIGIVHSGLGRPDSALAYFAQALPILRAVGDRFGEARTLNNIGAVHRAEGRPDSALAYYAQAMPIRRAVGDRAGEATTLNNIGAVHKALGRPDSALAYFAQALPILRAAGDRHGEARTLSNIGFVQRDLDRPDSALTYYAQALPIQRTVGDRSGEAITLSNTGFVHQYGVSPPRLRSAIAYYDSAAAALASIAAHAGGDQNRLSFAEQDVSLFRLWTLAWLALGDEAGARESALSALAAAERGRAQALLELMRRSSSAARGKVGIGRAAATPGADLAAEGKRLVAALSRSGTAALSYFVTSDTLLVWLIGPSEEVEVFRTNITEQELATEVAALRRGLGADSAAVRDRMALSDTPDLEAPQRGVVSKAEPNAATGASAARLANLLLPPALLEKLKQTLPIAGELVIVPHGSLNLVPFAALPVDPGGDLLGIRYSVRYSPSLATLAELGERKGRPAASVRSAALVVGNPTMPKVQTNGGTRMTLGPLPGAEAEGLWVAGRVGAALLRGGAATEAAVKRRLPQASLVHMATHGYAYSSEARARDSFIALAPTAGEDGLLTVGEVLDAVQSLSAELVVLSACQTGLGDLKQAEGTVGLQRAFLAKGARSVLVSLWSVSDEATAQLMRSFYAHWLHGGSKAEALRRAQVEVRGAPGSRFHDPRYWAAFQLVGAR